MLETRVSKLQDELNTVNMRLDLLKEQTEISERERAQLKVREFLDSIETRMFTFFFPQDARNDKHYAHRKRRD